ncbi:hypothetical protein [Kribbella sp. NPDC004536]|uniref:hypothetical protein n=1 Tax=Kribbella sp. NPDC004536 TaxID=3364106 RepID=UPI00367D01C4
MPDAAQRVPEDSAAYREFARLYDLARELRPTAVDGWNRALYATNGPGGFDHQSGAIGVDEPLLRHELTGRPSATPRRQAHALATVLHRATEAGMPKDAPGAANAVRNEQSLALHDGIASVRAATDFRTFAVMAGYPHATFDPSENTGTYAAANALIHQVSGPRLDREELLERLNQGPVAMQFDQLADAVVENRLRDHVAPEDRPAVRRVLIGTMLHPAWEGLAGQSPEAGRHVADEIGRALNAKVDEIRQSGPHGQRDASAGGTGAEAVRVPVEDVRAPVGAVRAQVDGVRAAGGEVSVAGGEVPVARFLSGVAPAGGAAGRKPLLGDGSRGAGEGGAVVPGRGTRASAREY